MDPEPVIRIETEELVLRPLALEDAATFFVLSNEPAFRRGLPNQVYADEAEATRVVETLIRQFEDPADPRKGPYVLAVEHRVDGALIGHVGFSPLEEEGLGDVEVGFAIAAAHQHRGLAVEAVTRACAWVADRFRLPEVVGLTASWNLPSKQVLLRSGFRPGGDRVMDFQGEEQPVSVSTWTRK